MPTRTVHFRSETSLAAFIRELPGKVAFEVEEDSTRPGHYTLHFL